MNSGWGGLFTLLLTAFVGWMLYLKIRRDPHLFHPEVLQKASFTLGLLAVFLICLVGFFAITM